MDPIKPESIQPTVSTDSIPVPTQVTPVVPMASPSPVVPTTPTAPVVLSQPVKQSGTLGAWLMLIIVIPFLVISILASIFISIYFAHDTRLLKTGTLGTAVVTATRDLGGRNSGPAYLISYHLIDVSGYSTQTYSSAVPGVDGQNVSSGQHMAVIYNPSNPSDNGLQVALENSSSSLATVLPWLFPVIPVIALIAIVINIVRVTRRKRAISSLSA